ncbi:hypothetical protein AAMO2058_001685400 [Amorphochlora amoebiformis]
MESSKNDPEISRCTTDITAGDAENEDVSYIERSLKVLDGDRHAYRGVRANFEAKIRKLGDPVRQVFAWLEEAEKSASRSKYTLELMLCNILQSSKVVSGDEKMRVSARQMLLRNPNLRPQIWARVVKIGGVTLSDKEVRDFVQGELINKGAVKDACDVILTLGIGRKFKSEELIPPLVRLGQYDVLKRFIQEFPWLREEAIRAVAIQGRRYATATKWMKHFKINPNLFPKANFLHRITTCKWLVRSGKAFEFADMVVGNEDLVLPFLSVLVEHGKGIFAADLAHRHSLWGYLQAFIKGSLTPKVYRSNRLISDIKAVISNKDKPLPASFFSGGPEKNREMYLIANTKHGILMVDDKKSLEIAKNELLDEKNPPLAVGLDSESIPQLFGAPGSIKHNQTVLLQISSDTRTYLFDLLKFDESMNSIVKGLFLSKKTTKIGYAFEDDIRCLRRSITSSTCFRNIVNFVELQRVERDMRLNPKLPNPIPAPFPSTPPQANTPGEGGGGDLKEEEGKHRKKRKMKKEKKKIPKKKKEKPTKSKGPIGLSKLTQKILGKPLCKDVQISNWTRRPLNPDQIEYAALDAYVLILIAQRLWPTDGNPPTAGNIKPMKHYRKDIVNKWQKM